MTPLGRLETTSQVDKEAESARTEVDKEVQGEIEQRRHDSD